VSVGASNRHRGNFPPIPFFFDSDAEKRRIMGGTRHKDRPMTPDPDRVQAIFLMALEHPLPEDRAAVLDRECKLDGELRRRVEALLIAHDRPGGQLDRPFVLSGDRIPVIPEPPPEATGRQSNGSGPPQ
jgi:hypothetical protein